MTVPKFCQRMILTSAILGLLATPWICPTTVNADPPSEDSTSEDSGRRGRERGVPARDRDQDGREGRPGRRGPDERGPQDRGPEGRGGGPRFGDFRGGDRPDPARMMQAFPVMAALDADHDGVLSESEIANAVTALKSIDRNKDGKIDLEEMRPRFGGGPFAMVNREGEGRGPRDGERGPGRGPRDGDRDPERGPRDGEGNQARGFGPQEMLARLKSLDANGEKVLSSEELPERAQPLLKRWDKDDSGDLSFAELEAVGQMARTREGEGKGFGNNRGPSRRGDGDRPGGDRPRRPPAE